MVTNVHNNDFLSHDMWQGRPRLCNDNAIRREYEKCRKTRRKESDSCINNISCALNLQKKYRSYIYVRFESVGKCKSSWVGSNSETRKYEQSSSAALHVNSDRGVKDSKPAIDP